MTEEVLILFEAQGGRLGVLKASGQQMRLRMVVSGVKKSFQNVAYQMLQAAGFPAATNEQWTETTPTGEVRHVFTHRSDSMVVLNTHLQRVRRSNLVVDGVKVEANFTRGQDTLLGLPSPQKKTKTLTKKRQSRLELLNALS
jgi:hypothetical protein